MPRRNYDGVKMPETDFLDNVPPNPEGHKPWRPDYPAPFPELVIDGNGNDYGNGNGNGAATTPAGQFPPIPNNIFGWFMLMMGL